MTHLPPPFLGHGPPKVPDNLTLWLIPHQAPSPAVADALAASLPKELRDWALVGDDASGSVEWNAGVLHVDSGMGVRYLVKSLDPDHLAWLPEHVREADIERILDEVMNATRTGPRAPKASDWDVFGAMIGAWVEAVHARCPLWMVVVDRKVKPPGTPRHQASARWVRDHLDPIATRHAATLAQGPPRPTFTLDPSAMYRWTDQACRATGWGRVVVASVLATKGKPPEPTRTTLLQLLVGSGMHGVALSAKLLGMWPKRQRPDVLADLLHQGHDAGLALLAAPSTHGLLLDDRVYDAAMTQVPRLFPGDMTLQVNKRMMASKLGEQQSEWLRRMLAVAERDGTLQGLADAEPPDQLSHKTGLRWWLALHEQLG